MKQNKDFEEWQKTNEKQLQSDFCSWHKSDYNEYCENVYRELNEQKKEDEEFILMTECGKCRGVK